MKIININNKTNDSADSLRKKYIILFVFLFIIVVNLYIFNPLTHPSKIFSYAARNNEHDVVIDIVKTKGAGK